MEKGAVYYKMIITKAGHKWTLEKRYSHFDALNKVLKKTFSGLPSLPAKSFFKIKEPSKLEARRIGL